MTKYINLIVPIKYLQGETRVEQWPEDLAKEEIESKRAIKYKPKPLYREIIPCKEKDSNIIKLKYEVISYKYAKKNNLLLGQIYELQTMDEDDIDYIKEYKLVQKAAKKGYVNEVPISSEEIWYDNFHKKIEAILIRFEKKIKK